MPTNMAFNDVHIRSNPSRDTVNHLETTNRSRFQLHNINPQLDTFSPFLIAIGQGKPTTVVSDMVVTLFTGGANKFGVELID